MYVVQLLHWYFQLSNIRAEKVNPTEIKVLNFAFHPLDLLPEPGVEIKTQLLPEPKMPTVMKLLEYVKQTVTSTSCSLNCPLTKNPRFKKKTSLLPRMTACLSVPHHLSKLNCCHTPHFHFFFGENTLCLTFSEHNASTHVGRCVAESCLFF